MRVGFFKTQHIPTVFAFFRFFSLQFSISQFNFRFSVIITSLKWWKRVNWVNHIFFSSIVVAVAMTLDYLFYLNSDAIFRSCYCCSIKYWLSFRLSAVESYCRYRCSRRHNTKRIIILYLFNLFVVGCGRKKCSFNSTEINEPKKNLTLSCANYASNTHRLISKLYLPIDWKSWYIWKMEKRETVYHCFFFSAAYNYSWIEIFV